MDPEGNCKGVDYSDPFGDWSSVVVQATTKVTLTDGIGLYNTLTSTVIVPGVTSCSYSESYCSSPSTGTVIWDMTQPKDCDGMGYSILWRGTGYKQIPSGNPPSREDFFTFVVESVNFVVAIKATGKSEYCNLFVYKTEHPRLYIVSSDSLPMLDRSKNIILENIDPFLYMNAKTVYVEYKLSSTMEDIANRLEEKLCFTKQQELQSRLSLARESPDEFAYLYNGGPGSTGGGCWRGYIHTPMYSYPSGATENG